MPWIEILYQFACLLIRMVSRLAARTALVIVARWSSQSRFWNLFRVSSRMFPFWFHHIPVICRQSGALAAIRLQLILFLRWKTLIFSLRVSALRCAIIDLVVAVVGVVGFGVHACLGAFPFFVRVAHVFAEGGHCFDGFEAAGFFLLVVGVFPVLHCLLLRRLLVAFVSGLSLMNVRWMEFTLPMTTCLSADIEAVIWFVRLAIIYFPWFISLFISSFWFNSIWLT